MRSATTGTGGRPGGNDVGDQRTRALLACGAAAGPVFVTTFVLEGAVRPDYDALRHPVSSLALGPGGWVQNLDFCLAGGLYLAGAVGLRRVTRGGGGPSSAGGRLVPPLVGAAAAGLVGAGVFLTDPVSGYPPGTADAPVSYSTSGLLHDLASVPTFLGIPAAAVLCAAHAVRRGRPGWATYSVASGVGMLGATVAASLAFGQAPALVAHGGLLQRAAVAIGFGWLTALHLRALCDR